MNNDKKIEKLDKKIKTLLINTDKIHAEKVDGKYKAVHTYYKPEALLEVIEMMNERLGLMNEEPLTHEEIIQLEVLKHNPNGPCEAFEVVNGSRFECDECVAAAKEVEHPTDELPSNWAMYRAINRCLSLTPNGLCNATAKFDRFEHGSGGVYVCTKCKSESRYLEGSRVDSSEKPLL